MPRASVLWRATCVGGKLRSEVQKVAVISVSPARALRRPIRLDVRAIVGILLMLVATGGSIAVWSTEQDTRGVLVLAHELPAGSTLQASDLTISRARLDDAVYQAAVPATSLNTVVGRQLAEPAHANQVLARAQVSTRPRLAEDQMVLAIPVRNDAAAGGRIRANDAVAVLATPSKGDSPARVVLPRAIVYEVGREQTASFSTANQSSTAANTSSAGVAWLTLIVTQDQAVQLAQARWSSDLDVALLPAQ
jgi:Flp pilus assembly protein CpaB